MDLAVSTSHKQFIAHESFRYFIWRWPGNAITSENSGKGVESGRKHEGERPCTLVATEVSPRLVFEARKLRRHARRT